MESRLEVSVGANISELSKNLAKGQKDISSFSTNASKELSKLDAASRSGGQSLDKFSKSSNSAGFALTNLGRVAQDAPFGFIGIQNNLNPLLESFAQLRKESGSNAAALKALGSSLIGPAGIGIALSVVSAGILLYQEYTRKAAKNTKELESATTSLANSASDEVGKLTLLYDAATNANIPLSQRKQIVDELQSQYPAYFKNLTDEEILAGKAGNAYKQLTKDLINSSIARGAEKLISEQVNKLAELSISLGLAATKTKGLNEAQKLVKASGAGGFFIDETSAKKELKTIEGFRKDATDEIDAIRKSVQQVTQGFNASSILDNFSEQGNKGKSNSIKIKPRIDIEPVIIATDNGKAITDATKPFVEKLIKQFQTIDPPIVAVPLDVILTNTKPISEEDIKKLINFETLETGISDLLSSIPQKIGETLSTAFEAVGSALASGANPIEAFGSVVLSSFGSFLSEFGKLLIKYGIAGLALSVATKAMANPITAAPAALAAIAAGTALSIAGGAIKSFATGSGGSNKQGGYKIPGFATGVSNFGGGMALVGERGPELVTLGRGSNVITNENISKYGNRSGQSQVFIAESITRGADLVTVYKRAQTKLSKVI